MRNAKLRGQMSESGPVVLKDWETIKGSSLMEFELTNGLRLAGLNGIRVEYILNSLALGAGNFACSIWPRSDAGVSVSRASMFSEAWCSGNSIVTNGESKVVDGLFLYRSMTGGSVKSLKGFIEYMGVNDSGVLSVAGRGENMGVAGVTGSERVFGSKYNVISVTNTDNQRSIWFKDPYSVATSLRYRIIKNHE